jgi:putative NADH-flavin reductase
MPTITKVALAGASGSLGKPVLEHLLSGNFSVTVLTREDSTSTFPAGVVVVKVDYTSKENLTAALEGQHALISTLATEVISSQDILIKAAIAARVYRIIPSEFGSDDFLEANRKYPEVTRGWRQRH